MFATGIVALVTDKEAYRDLSLLGFGTAGFVAFFVTLSKLFHDPDL
jgi:hypothetical protein